MIIDIHTRNFRGVAERTISFGQIGQYLIKGPNEIGKSTVKEALAFVFYGVDSHGTKNPDHLIRIGEQQTEVAVRTSKATFVRTKKRGAVSVIKLNQTGMPEIKPTQTDLTKLMGMEYDLFASCFITGYFMSLSEAKRREVISQAFRLDRAQLLRELTGGIPINPKLVKLENPRIDAQAVARERQALQNVQASEEGALGQVQAQLSDQPTEVDEATYEGELKKLKAEVQLIDFYENDLRKFQFADRTYKERDADNKRREAERQRVELELQSLGDCPTFDEEEAKKRYSELMQQAEAIQLLAPPASPHFHEVGGEASCTRCGRPITENLRASLEVEKAAAINTYNEEARKVADENNNRTAKQKAIRDQAAVVAANASKVKTSITDWKAKHSALQTRLDVLKPLENPAPSSPEMPECMKIPQGAESSKQKHDRLQAELQAYRMVKTRADGAREKREQLTQSIAKRARQIEELSKLEGALKDLPAVEVKRTLEQLQLPRAIVSFEESELRVTDERGIPYASLSDGRKMKLDLEWCKRFRGMVKNPPPFLFIDNADLVDSFADTLPKDVQVFLASVDPLLTELQVVQL